MLKFARSTQDDLLGGMIFHLDESTGDDFRYF